MIISIINYHFHQLSFSSIIIALHRKPNYVDINLEAVGLLYLY